MSNRKYVWAWVVIYFLISSAIFTGAAMAQDTSTAFPDTPTPPAEVTPDSNVPPAPEPAPTGIPTADLFLVVIVIVGLVATLVLREKSTHEAIVQLGASAPEWAWQGVKTTTITGLDALAKEAKKTIETYDDEEVERLRKIAVETIAEIDAKRVAVAQGLPVEKSKLTSVS